MTNSKPWKKYPLIANELAQVNELLKQTMHAPNKNLESALKEMADNGGKYLRPSLVLLAAHAVGKTNKQIIQIATAIETLHMATLIHDDVIDDSDKRRGKPSIQFAFGKDVAVYAGDLLFTNFFDLMLDVNEPEYLRLNAQTMRQILNGELGQMNQRFNLEQTFDDYLADIKGKTATLFRLAAEEGAHFAGGNLEQTQILANFAEDLGIAFQIIDDILDYRGSSQLNKPMLEDLPTGVYSLPLLLTLKQPDLKAQLLPLLNKRTAMTVKDIKQIQAIVIDSGAITESKQLAQNYAQKGIAELAKLAPNPAVKILEKMAKELLQRTF
ncbi:polyprenyl synthetase family protein [Lactobacillus jensenii]|jgi:polyprenyl synthetase|uniref:Polyprenyl synthetase family protein n=1 Tax=Lactobacillus jensenii TaxID=109790 RepID=A0ABU9FKC6_LACJE|nr:polyprenyl synthetase family protein [Lactobacillus jensenii]ERJ43363.1 farnesyl pyrophosphate synthetase [Lactobacillus jensenii MD IIE-70(2)]APT14346.1 farnesyl pyrophosphate synthetase [Lactobacillus jensenii]EEQ24394.1 polyprenyl synthetase [Lactobacillus jensenii 269-3]EEX28148.1 polyprenyl synthetase [Lactobacillus jensenii SJ-7A-US]KAA9235338.1 polyprenyl synthetase family protein [Lactobacillus jensenii]